MKNIKNTKLFFIAMLNLWTLPQAFGMQHYEVSAPDAPALAAEPAAFAEQVVTITSNDGKKYPVSLNLLATPFRDSAALSQVLYNMFKDFENREAAVAHGDLHGHAGKFSETPVNLNGNTLKKVIAIFTHLYEAKKYVPNIEDEANYAQILDRESATIFTDLPIEDKRSLLFELYAAADFLDSQAIYDLCERQFISPETMQDFIAHPQEYVSQRLLRIKTMQTSFPSGTYHTVQTLQANNTFFMTAIISADSNLLIRALSNGAINIRTKNPATGIFDLPPQTIEGHTAGATCLAISPDNQLLISGSADHTIKIWENNPRTNSFDIPPQTLLGHANWVTALDLSIDKNFIVSGSDDHSVRLWQKNAATQTFNPNPIILGSHNDSVCAVAIAPDNSFIISGSTDRTILMWVKNPKTNCFDLQQQIFDQQDNIISCLAISRDNKHIVCGGHNGTIKLWTKNPENGLFDLPPHLIFSSHEPIQSIAISPDSSIIVGGCNDNTVKVFTKNSITNLFDHAPQTLTIPESFFNKITVAQSGNYIVSCSASAVYIYYHKSIRRQESVLRALLIQAIKQTPNHLLDLSEAPIGQQTIVEIIDECDNASTREYLSSHIILPNSVAAPADAKSTGK